MHTAHVLALNLDALRVVLHAAVEPALAAGPHGHGPRLRDVSGGGRV